MSRPIFPRQVQRTKEELQRLLRNVTRDPSPTELLSAGVKRLLHIGLATACLATVGCSSTPPPPGPTSPPATPAAVVVTTPTPLAEASRARPAAVEQQPDPSPAAPEVSKPKRYDVDPSVDRIMTPNPTPEIDRRRSRTIYGMPESKRKPRPPLQKADPR